MALPTVAAFTEAEEAEELAKPANCTVVTVGLPLGLYTGGGAMLTLGILVYPLPPDVTVIAVTTPPLMVAVATAVVPLAGADMVTRGATLYPAPPFLTVMAFTELPDRLALAPAHRRSSTFVEPALMLN
jgi:hypothetical protein